MEVVGRSGRKSGDDHPSDITSDRGTARGRDAGLDRSTDSCNRDAGLDLDSKVCNRDAIVRERTIAHSRSLVLSGLSIGFSPPTGATLEVLGTEENAATLAAAAALLDAETGGGLADRARAFLGFCSSETVPVAVHAGRRTGGGDGPSEPRSGAGSPWTTEPLSQAYTRLFGHTARGGVSPYETEYGDDTLFQKPQELSDIAGFLRAFGLVLDPRTRERIDHVSCELEFMAFLARKEAYAAEIDDQPMRAETRRTSGLFLKDHLGRVVPSFARSVLKEDPDGFYGALAALCLEFVESDCTRFGVPIGPSMLRLRNVIDDGAPIACGTDHCPALPRDEEGRP